jgi:3-oxoacyl-[acyl-carrier-protein] synthase-1
MSKVYLTGLGFITSIGNDAPSVSTSLKEMRHGVVRYAPFESPMVPVKVAAPVKGFDTDSLDAEDWTYPSTYI